MRGDVERIRKKIASRWDATWEISPGLVCEHYGWLVRSYRVYIYDWARFLSTPAAKRQLEALKKY